MPPKSQTTASPRRMMRSAGSWWGLAAFGPEPPRSRSSPSSGPRDRRAPRSRPRPRPRSCRPRAISPARSADATRSAAAPAARERGDLPFVLHGADRCPSPTMHAGIGRRAGRPAGQEQRPPRPGPRRRVPARRPTSSAIDRAPRPRSPVRDGARSDARRRATRGASSSGTTRVALSSAGQDEAVGRSSGIASYPDSHGRSAPRDRTAHRHQSCHPPAHACEAFAAGGVGPSACSGELTPGSATRLGGVQALGGRGSSNGSAATPRRGRSPSRSALSRIEANSSGVHQRGDGQCARRWPQVLAHRHDVDADGGEVRRARRRPRPRSRPCRG